MRIVVLIALFAVSAGQAAAQQLGSCTFTWNSTAKRIESKCTGMPAAPLGLNERIALQDGTYKQCVVELERITPTQVKPKPAVCK